MIRILLACSAGMSTSLLVKKMEAAAKESGLEAKIWAIPEGNLRDEIANCDILLLGPQVRYILPKAKELAAPHNIPVDVIDMRNYGMCNGAKVLEAALKLKK